MQNVDINKEVQRAMMSPPQQPRGIIDLLASELKAQDAQAKNKIRAMMAGSPPQDTVLAQNEKTAEDSVRQEIAQKMQAMAVKERQNQARMNRALQGIAAQSAPNMRMMDGGIVGYQAGGNVQTPPKPTMGAVPPSGVGNDQIKQYAEEYMGIKKALENPENAQYKERNQMLLQDLIRQMGDQMPAVMQYIDSMKGIVAPRGFQEGGGIFGPTGIFGPSARAASGFTQFLASKGIESLAGLSEAASRRLMEEFLAQKSAGDRRTELAEMAGAPGSEGARQAQPEIPERPYIPTGRASVADSQMENLAGVTRDGANLLREGIASLAPEPRGRNRTELADMGGAPGSEGAPVATRRGVFDTGGMTVEELQRQLESVESSKSPMEIARQGFRNTQAVYEGTPTTDESPLTAEQVASMNRNIARGDSLGQELVRRIEADPANAISTAMMLIPIGGWAGALGTKAISKLIPYVVKHPMLASFLTGATMKLPVPDIEKTLTSIGLGEDLEEVKDTILTELLAPDPLDELRAPEQTDEEVAQKIIDTGVTAEQYRAATGPAAPAGRTLSREEIDAGSALAREAEMGGPEAARRGASYLATRGGETALVDLANTVAQDATPENMNRFESEIQRLMERRESPIRALSSFLTAFSQARGGSMGQNLAIATTAMRAADDALDSQIIELEKLRRADQISERDFSLKQDELEAQKALIAAQASYYQRMPEVQKEVELLRQAGNDKEADRLIRREAVTALMPMQMMFRTLAERELGRGASETDIQRKATELFEARVNSLIKVMEGPRARTGAANFGDQFADTMTVTP